MKVFLEYKETKTNFFIERVESNFNGKKQKQVNRQNESSVDANEAIPADVGRLLQDEQPFVGLRPSGGQRQAERLERRLPHQL